MMFMNHIYGMKFHNSVRKYQGAVYQIDDPKNQHLVLPVKPGEKPPPQIGHITEVKMMKTSSKLTRKVNETMISERSRMDSQSQSPVGKKVAMSQDFRSDPNQLHPNDVRVVQPSKRFVEEFWPEDEEK